MITLLCTHSVQSNDYLSYSDPLKNEEKIQFSVENQPVYIVLNQINEKYDLNFSYNAGNKSFQNSISYQTNGKPLRQILDDIMSLSGHDYKRVGNHLVVFSSSEPANQSRVNRTSSKSPSAPEINKQKINSQQTNNNAITNNEIATKQGKKNNSMYEPAMYSEAPRDTIFVRDTIFQVEKVIIRDTVVVEKLVGLSTDVPRPVSLFSEIFNIEVNNREQWGFSLNYSHMLTSLEYFESNLPENDLNRITGSEGLSLRNFGLGAELRYNTGNLTLTSGISLLSFSSRFSYREINTTGGFNQIDTLDTFYTLNQNNSNDTIWKYVTDTTYIPLDSEEIFYDRLNRRGFLEMNLSAIYNLVNTNQFSFFVKGGIHGGLPIWLNGNTITNSENLPATDISDQTFSNQLWAYRAGAGLRFRISQFNDFYAETYYKRYFNNLDRNFPVERRLLGFGLQLGVIYYL